MTRKTPAERLADELLHDADTETLLTKAFALTHRMHVCTDTNVSADLRAARDLICAEILRRAERKGA